MANTVSGFFQTLVSAASQAAEILKPTWNAVQSVYADYKSANGDLGQTINVNIPVDPTNSVVDAGLGDIVLSDIAWTTVPIVFDKHPSFGFPVRDLEQYQSEVDIRQAFMDSALTGVMNNINAVIANLFTTTNFATNTAIATTGGVITTTQFLAGQAVLLDQKVPALANPADMTLLVPAKPYTLIEDNANWTQAQIVGDGRADRLHGSGIMPTAYGASIKIDQQMPTSGTAPSRTFTGAYFHRYAVALASRPLPLPDANVVHYTYVPFYGVMLRIMVGYDQLKTAYIVTIDAGYGVKVVRPEMCQLFTIAE